MDYIMASLPDQQASMVTVRLARILSYLSQEGDICLLKDPHVEETTYAKPFMATFGPQVAGFKDGLNALASTIDERNKGRVHYRFLNPHNVVESICI